jgi:hypothetical protein
LKIFIARISPAEPSMSSKKKKRGYGEYRTRCLVLEAWDRLGKY